MAKMIRTDNAGPLNRFTRIISLMQLSHNNNQAIELLCGSDFILVAEAPLPIPLSGSMVRGKAVIQHVPSSALASLSWAYIELCVTHVAPLPACSASQPQRWAWIVSAHE